MSATPLRATNLNEFQRLQDASFPEESKRRAKNLALHPDDVVICPYYKSGTTWLQQMAHALRSGGDTGFEEISFEVPWIEVAQDLGVDLDAPQRFAPRLFKSHFEWGDVPKGGRYVCAFREPTAVVASYHRFMEGWFVEPGTIGLDEFAEAFCPTADELYGYWAHLVSWWEQRHDERVLLLCYEDMVLDLAGTVRVVADFMGVGTDERTVATAIERSSRDYMLKHKDKFDERGVRGLVSRRTGLPFESDAAKVTRGSKDALSPRLIARFDEVWRKQVEPRCGLENYRALRAALKEPARSG